MVRSFRIRGNDELDRCYRFAATSCLFIHFIRCSGPHHTRPPPFPFCSPLLSLILALFLSPFTRAHQLSRPALASPSPVLGTHFSNLPRLSSRHRPNSGLAANLPPQHAPRSLCRSAPLSPSTVPLRSLRPFRPAARWRIHKACERWRPWRRRRRRWPSPID